MGKKNFHYGYYRLYKAVNLQDFRKNRTFAKPKRILAKGKHIVATPKRTFAEGKEGISPSFNGINRR